MTQQVKHSVVPIYLVGAVWLVYALLFPLYRPVHYILCALVSGAAYVLGRALFPDTIAQSTQTQNTQTKAAGQTSGQAKPRSEPKPDASSPAQEKPSLSPEVQALLKERDRALGEMRRLNDAIEDPKISAQIDHLEDVTAKILNLVAQEPEKLPQIRRFMDYYLPTTLKILNAYDRMGSTGISGSNIDATKAKVEKMMDTIVVAYDRQLDALFGEEALDISTDITVMENLLAQEGLGGMNISSTSEKPADDDGIRLEL